MVNTPTLQTTRSNRYKKELDMNHCAKHILKAGWLAGLLLGLSVASCTDLIYDDRDGCERGVYVNFVYDYNLHRSDLFADHVGEVTLYIFDEQGNYIDSRTEANDDELQPLREYGYNMYLDLPDGKYRFVALAHQRKSDDRLRGSFQRTEMNANSRMEDLQITLDHTRLDDGIGLVNHRGEPLDTLWHSISDRPVEVRQGQYAYHTLSLVRNTKYISVVLRDIDEPAAMDIDDYNLYITGGNIRLNHDNSEDPGIMALCTPYVTWNTHDPDVSNRASTVGNMGHADFMTSRIFVHDNTTDDEVLVVEHKGTGKRVIEVNLPDLLGRLCNYDELHRYSRQEFLDRGYDYDLTFFLSDGSWAYANVSIGVLGWSKRIQNVAL